MENVFFAWTILHGFMKNLDELRVINNSTNYDIIKEGISPQLAARLCPKICPEG
jgi:hypothetical protein